MTNFMSTPRNVIKDYLLPQYAFMAWCLVKSTGATLPLPLQIS